MLCNKLTRENANKIYEEALNSGDTDALRLLCTDDLFFLLAVALNRKDANRDWIYKRCREVEAAPDDRLDLWAREHYKSTIITFALTIQNILNDPEITVGIFSHTRPIAKGFLEQIKRELETNGFIKKLFPEILYSHPQKESPSWSLDGGILVKRKSNPKEKTVEAWGLVDGQPTSKHFKLLIYDDMVTKESVTTPDQINKVTEAWGLSLNLGSEGGKRRYVGTRYHFNDTYKTMLSRGSAIARIHPATDNGKIDGRPVLLSVETLDKKRRDEGPYTFSCQQLLNPVADKAMGFKEEWLNFYTQGLEQIEKHWVMNKYILVDPASKKKKHNDYSVFAVIGLAQDNNYYLIDGVRDRLNLTERTKTLFRLVRKHKPLNVGYEEYGLQSDIEHVKYVMEQENYRFKLTPLGGSAAKEDRIKRLIPLFEQARFWVPSKLLFKDCDLKVRDLIKEFIDDEFLAFPVSTHDDMLDCFSRIVDTDLHARFPEMIDDKRAMAHKLIETPKCVTEYEVI